MQYDAICMIPRSGRTFENFLTKLIDLGVNKNEVKKLTDIVRKGKKEKNCNINKALALLNTYLKATNSINLFIDRKRENRPYRIGFFCSEWKINNTTIRFEGAEPHNCSSLVTLGEADISIAGLDELLSVTQNSLSYSKITKWGMYNYNHPATRQVKVAGSAMLKSWNSTINRYVQDIVGFFLIAKNTESKTSNTLENPEYLHHLEENGSKVFVKSRYANMIKLAYPSLNIVPVHDVEDAVVESIHGDIGLEIVQSGSTLIKKNLIILGSPLFLSETLYVVDHKRYTENEKVRKFVNSLKPVSYFDDEHLLEFAYWYYALEKNTKNSWISKPNIEELFCSTSEINNGLRPYRLKTRYWTPDDKYKIIEAKKEIKKAINKLNKYYIEITKKYVAN